MCLGVPGRIEEILNNSPLQRSARVSFGGIVREINLAYVPDAQTGDYVIVHVGVAISVVRENEAQKIFHELEQLVEPITSRGNAE
ncbi:Hydrogenase isoenzymes formation protein HypC [Microbulbifer aggregans]|uniref:Hydrogenase isoenzymes formation protein HypC n=1 Tax=Microbulbifer aggregans TaxID=1769779 RepID=A0A1C9W9V0_9GAMM|nr:HypC/HybG/HupF family hydrogenase formation chaperone [Microbulbifer aggregans]AOS97936.1 Hydrogenase isoenzymes formation protein HypC [Microbulbifer aggregans]